MIGSNESLFSKAMGFLFWRFASCLPARSLGVGRRLTDHAFRMRKGEGIEISERKISERIEPRPSDMYNVPQICKGASGNGLYCPRRPENFAYYQWESKMIFESKGGKEEKLFDALDWLAAMTSHVPNKGEQMVRYSDHYSNASRGLRQKKNLDDLIPSILEPEDKKPSCDGLDLASQAWCRAGARAVEGDSPIS